MYRIHLQRSWRESRTTRPAAHIYIYIHVHIHIYTYIYIYIYRVNPIYTYMYAYIFIKYIFIHLPRSWKANRIARPAAQWRRPGCNASCKPKTYATGSETVLCIIIIHRIDPAPVELLLKQPKWRKGVRNLSSRATPLDIKIYRCMDVYI